MDMFLDSIWKEIDKSKLSAVTKFSYLKEPVTSNVRVFIDGLEFTTESYKKAKNLLHTKFGETSEVHWYQSTRDVTRICNKYYKIS